MFLFDRLPFYYIYCTITQCNVSRKHLQHAFIYSKIDITKEKEAGIMEPTIVWLVLLIVFIGIEILTLGLTTIWFAGGCVPAFIAALCGAPVLVQILVFLTVSLILLFFTRPVAVKYFNRDRIKTNAESLVGRTAIVI